jgi:hypothetical protein
MPAFLAQRLHQSGFELGHQAALEVEAVVAKGLQRHRQAHVGIGWPWAWHQSASVKPGTGADRLEAKPSDFRHMPRGMCSRQKAMGWPKMRRLGVWASDGRPATGRKGRHREWRRRRQGMMNSSDLFRGGGPPAHRILYNFSNIFLH